MKKLGILGGMGPLATQLLYRMIIENTVASKDQEHIDMIILNHSTIPDRTEAIKSGNVEKILGILTDDAKFLEKGGCTSIAIPCNTSHYFYDKIQSKVNIPIINMIHAAIESVKEKKSDIKRVGILATDGTVYSDIYRKECEKFGIEAIYPDAENQKRVMDIIYNQIKKGEKGNLEDFEKIDEYLKKSGCEGAVLACTELSCFKENHNLSEFYTDALESLCKKSIIMCDGTLKGDI